MGQQGDESAKATVSQGIGKDRCRSLNSGAVEHVPKCVWPGSRDGSYI